MKDLASLPDTVLISKVKENVCNDSLIELSNRYSAVCFDIAKKYAPAISMSGVDVKDITDQRIFFVYKASISFNPDKKVKFSTWLGNFTKYQCLNAINQSKTLNYMDNDALTAAVESKLQEAKPQDCRENKDFDEYVFNILNKLKDKRISRVFNLRYFSGEKKLTWQKVARKLKISTQTAINLHEKGRIILKNKINSEKISDLI